MAAERRWKQAEPPPATPIVPPAPAAERSLYAVKNLLGQVITISLLNEAGVAESERIPAHGQSRPVTVDRIGPYTRVLVEQGHAKIVPAS